MDGGNAQKSKMAHEKNLEKVRAAGKGSQLDANNKATNISAKCACRHSYVQLQKPSARSMPKQSTQKLISSHASPI